MTQPPQRSDAEQSQAAQAGLAAVVARALLAAFPHLNLSDSRSIALFTKLVEAVVAKYAAASATLSVRSYTAARKAADVPGAFTPIPADVPTADDVQAAVEWAVRSQIVPEPDLSALERDVTLSAQKLVQDTGRSTIIDNVQRDRQASAWYRQTEPARSKTGVCAFCAMLASRGAVYTEQTADFAAHPGCQCHAEPVFAGYKPSPQVQQWREAWDRVTKGRSGADARAAFRQHIEGRPVTGLTRGPNAPKKRGKTRAETAPTFVRPDRQDAERMISMFEASNARAAGNPKLASMIAANNARIAELRQGIAQPL